MLEEVDFDDDEDATYHPDFLGFQTHEHVSYAIQMAKLARLRKSLRDILKRVIILIYIMYSGKSSPQRVCPW